MDDIERAARKRLRFRRLRPGQREAVEAVVAGRNALVVFPTGAGKSAVYRIAGHLLHGPTVVVSPLIALQRDQVDDIEEREPGQAAQLNSSLRASERREAIEGLQDGDIEYLLLAPEQFADEERLRAIVESGPSLFVVDEAHCISQWGHDFRPEYLRLHEVIEALGSPTVLALTASAAPAVREEILGRLGIPDAEVIVRGFDRPNIWLGVERFADERTKMDAIADRVASERPPGIVYAATRRHVEELEASLRERGIEVVAYHGGLPDGERHDVQDAFMEGRVDTIVATNAFGMGVDKADVRFVFHADVPGSLDAYHQEIGRAGRDGRPARALLFYRSEDFGLQRYFAGSPETADDEQEERHRRIERTRVEMMRAYAEAGDCRREVLLNYFGERLPKNCGRCDNCEAGRSVEQGDGGPFPVGARVRHADWGEGRVQRYSGDAIVVAFDDMGYRTLALEVVLQRGLLERVP